MPGDIDMAKYRILKLPLPTDDQEAASKKYHDDNLPPGGYTEGARVYHDAPQAIPDNTWTDLAFNSERWDTDVIHDVAVNNSRLTCRTAGVYAIVFHGNFAAHAVGARQFLLFSNLQGNIGMVQLGLSAFNVFATSVATILDLAVDEFLYVEVYQNSGGPLNIEFDAQYTPEFMMQRIG
ncbi:hypothetical protein ES703_103587 [subsurface metagenome]